MGWCKNGLKCILALINVVILLLGAFLLFCGFMMMNTNGGMISMVNIKPVVVMFSTAAITIAGSILGICGAFTEKKGCLGVYMVFIFSELIILVVLTVLFITMKSPLENSVDTFVFDEMNLYGLSSNESVVVNNNTLKPNDEFNTTLFIDIIQQEAKCCGYNNYTDWSTMAFASKNLTDVPLSCCKNSTNCTGSLDDLELIYTEGCLESVNKFFSYSYGFVAWTTLGLSVLVFSAIVIAIGLLCARRSNPFGYTGLGSEPGYTTA